ncbi:MAG: hypothetical protein K2L28_00800 [Muribaculaceae bacterium]|nr:hypothetical protein [Muribaculaceae bacterium]
MKTVCFICLSVAIVAFLVCFLSLFDIVDVTPSQRNIAGAVTVTSLCLFIKYFIRLYRSTRRH